MYARLGSYFPVRTGPGAGLCKAPSSPEASVAGSGRAPILATPDGISYNLLLPRLNLP